MQTHTHTNTHAEQYVVTWPGIWVLGPVGNKAQSAMCCERETQRGQTCLPAVWFFSAFCVNYTPLLMQSTDADLAHFPPQALVFPCIIPAITPLSFSKHDNWPLNSNRDSLLPLSCFLIGQFEFSNTDQPPPSLLVTGCTLIPPSFRPHFPPSFQNNQMVIQQLRDRQQQRAGSPSRVIPQSHSLARSLSLRG